VVVKWNPLSLVLIDIDITYITFKEVKGNTFTPGYLQIRTISLFDFATGCCE